VRRLACLLSAAWLATAATAAPVDEAIRVLAPESLNYRGDPAAPGVGIAVVDGDPKAGAYTLRVRFPPQARAAPHRHPDRRVVSVLEGRYCLAAGAVFDAAALVCHGAGTVLVVPAGTAHYSAAGDEGTLVQETGPGPTALIPVAP
jgi:quercetin dioxygenase-like cupin family protein